MSFTGHARQALATTSLEVDRPSKSTLALHFSLAVLSPMTFSIVAVKMSSLLMLVCLDLLSRRPWRLRRRLIKIKNEVRVRQLFRLRNKALEPKTYARSMGSSATFQVDAPMFLWGTTTKRSCTEALPLTWSQRMKTTTRTMKNSSSEYD